MGWDTPIEEDREVRSGQILLLNYPVDQAGRYIDRPFPTGSMTDRFISIQSISRFTRPIKISAANGSDFIKS